jgi:hypothetical protein
VKKMDLLKMLKVELVDWNTERRQCARYSHGWNYAKGGADAVRSLIEKVNSLPAESEEK